MFGGFENDRVPVYLLVVRESARAGWENRQGVSYGDDIGKMMRVETGMSPTPSQWQGERW